MTVKDPLSRSDHVDVNKYLNEILTERGNPDYRFISTVSGTINSYRKDLFNYLKFRDHLDKFKNKKVEIQIREREPSRYNTRAAATQGKESIHRLHWEHLEDLSLWTHRSWIQNPAPISVTVRRLVGSPGWQATPQRSPTKSMHSGKVPPLKILLIVARKHVHVKHHIDWFNPTLVQRAILEAREELLSRNSPQEIELEVVRPGRLEELRQHLDNHQRQEGENCFHIIHFDLHGDTS